MWRSCFLGETPYMCAIRELYEETGIKVDSLIETGRIFSEEGHYIHVGFLCIIDCDKKSIVLQKDETCDYMWISKKELIKMRRGELLT